MTVHLERTKRTLRQLKPFLIDWYHVDSMGLFGSIVRNDFKPDSSDVDIVVSFTQPVGVEFIDMADLLEQKLQRKVDLVSRKGIKETYFKTIENEIVYV